MSAGVIVPSAFFTVAAIVIVIAVGWVLVNKRAQHQHFKADEIHEQAKTEARQLNQREALAEETAARARAAQADADVKTAHASKLGQQAVTHRSEAKTSPTGLGEQWEHAHALDPTSQAPDNAKSTNRD